MLNTIDRFTLLEEAYLDHNCEDGAFYRAAAIDDSNDPVTLKWNIINAECENAEDACDWTNYTVERKSKNTLFEIADAIMDSAAGEYRERNLESVESVQAYADGGMNIKISRLEAQLIRVVCLRAIEKESMHYHNFELIFKEIQDDPA